MHLPWVQSFRGDGDGNRATFRVALQTLPMAWPQWSKTIQRRWRIIIVSSNARMMDCPADLDFEVGVGIGICVWPDVPSIRQRSRLFFFSGVWNRRGKGMYDVPNNNQRSLKYSFLSVGILLFNFRREFNRRVKLEGIHPLHIWRLTWLKTSISNDPTICFLKLAGRVSEWPMHFDFRPTTLICVLQYLNSGIW